MLNLWQRELEDIVFTDGLKMKLDGPAVYKQCIRQMQPLITLLKSEEISIEILDPVFVMVHYCTLKEYVRANEIYMALCIGNSPWPMGVTQVGIHQRSSRSRIE